MFVTTTTMNNDKLIQFVKRWRDIESRQKSVDYDRSRLASDIRHEFPSGDVGDKKFVNWCAVELGLSEGQSKELLLRAVAFAVVPDEKTYNNVGGYKAIRHLQDLSKRDQVNILEAAKTSGRAILSVVKERGLAPKTIPATVPPARAPVKPYKPFVSESPTARASATEDAEALSRYIAMNCKNIPKDILTIMNRYTIPVRRRAV